MDDFTADPRPAWDVCREAVQSCQGFVLLVGGRYGSLVTTGPYAGMSYTEMEFRLAEVDSLPRLVFVLDDEAARRDPTPGRTRAPASDEDRRTRFMGVVHDSVTTTRVGDPADLVVRVRAALDRIQLPDPPTNSRVFRPRVAILAAGVLTVVIAVVAVVVQHLVVPDDRGGNVVAQVGPRTDPCALWDPSTAPAGTVATVIPDYGAAAACTLAFGPHTARITLTVAEGTYPRPDVSSAFVGPFQVTRSCMPEACEASVIPHVNPVFGVQLSTDTGTSGPGVSTLETLQRSVIGTLTSGRAPAERPELRPGSALRVPVCSLLGEADLAGVGGLSDMQTFPLFGGWSCEVGDPSAGPGANSVVGLGYGRSQPDDFPRACSPPDGPVTCPPDGSEEDDGRRGCAVTVRGPRFTAADGTERYEEVQVVVRSPAPRTVAQVCDDARRLGTAAATRLPG